MQSIIGTDVNEKRKRLGASVR